jgi:molecular chaperone DnaK (HSP70)
MPSLADGDADQRAARGAGTRRDNWRLGEFELPFEPAAKGHARVGVQFEIDANGILHVLARDTKTGAEKVVQMTSADRCER